MNAQNTESSTKIKRESKNRIRVDFERTSFWTRFRLKFLTGTAFAKAIWWIFRFILLLGVSYVILQPFYAKIASSFMGREDFVDVTVKLIPKHATLDTYKAIIEETHYLEAFLNTSILSVTCALIQTVICSLIGYGFAKYKFKGSKLLFGLVLLTMIVPHNTLKLSLFMTFKGFGKFGINTFYPLYLLSLGGLAFKNGLFIFMMRQFFRGVPDELEESAYIDGYGPIKTFFKIIVPISIPMMITVFLFAFSWQWMDNFYSDLFFSDIGPKFFPDVIFKIPKGLETSGFAGQNLFESAIRNTSGLLILTPLLVVYLFCQRYLVQGIERSGIVG